MSEILGRNVLITGAASGIGRLTGLKMAKLGANLILWDINGPALEKVADEFKQATGREPKTYVCDVSDRKSVYEVADKVKADVGAVDILINNAGVVSGKALLEIPDEKIEKTFAVNTLALFWMTKAFLPAMIQRNQGHVVTIASSAGLVGVPRLTDYAASKWAAVGFDESLRMELREVAPRVKTTVVCPFFIDTGMFKGATTRFPRLLPILKEDDVAEHIVAAIRADKTMLAMPPLVHTIPVMRALPSYVFDEVATFLGVNDSMKKFVGRVSNAIGHS